MPVLFMDQLYSFINTGFLAALEMEPERQGKDIYMTHTETLN